MGGGPGMTAPALPSGPGGRWCQMCNRWAIECLDPGTHAHGWMVPPYNQAPMNQPRGRSVVGTTLIVLLTVFVIAPLLVIAGCSAVGTFSYVLFGS